MYSQAKQDIRENLAQPSIKESASRIANSAESVVSVLNDSKMKKAHWIKLAWDRLKSVFVFVSVFFGTAFAIEQYLSSQYYSEKGRIETMLLSSSSSIGSSDHVVRANALRTLAKISEFATYHASRKATDFFQHISSSVWGFEPEYPFFEQSWMIFNDFAISPRKSEHHLVSSVLLLQGATWEKRIKNDVNVPHNWNKGSLLFNAELPYAIGHDLDLRKIHFGSANLKGANISNSDCSNCSLLGANLNNATLRGVRLDRAYLSESNMNSIDLSFAWLRESVLKNSHIRNGVFLQADLTGADLSFSDLQGAVFHQSELNDVNFTGANLKAAKFIQTDLSTVSFRQANIEGADFSLAQGVNENTFKYPFNSESAKLPNIKE